jgi:hypothetical protein
MWSARRIIKDLADRDLRKKILAAFWRYAEPSAKAMATAQLARAIHFRDETLRKLPVEKKADLLASRIGAAEFDPFLETALMQYHTHEANEMMGAFLDRWRVPHVNGSIESEDYKAPTAEQVRSAVAELSGTHGTKNIALYLASAGLLMSDQWREATWPVVDEMVGSSLPFAH